MDFETIYLPLLVFLPTVFALVVPFIDESKLHKVATVFGLIPLALSVAMWSKFPATELSFSLPWFPQLGISFALGMDGISMTLVALTAFLLLMAIIASYTSITHRLKFYYSMIFLLATALFGVFTARDAFTFFLFYELELIPMYFLIAIWGGPRRDYAATKFVLYTLFGSIFLLVGILGLYLFTRNAGYAESAFMFETIATALANGKMALPLQIWLFSILFIGFSVKLPMVPFHTWLPDAHVEAPTPISMLLAGVLLKMGAYGMLRLCYELLPEAALYVSPWIAILALINILYTAYVALVQSDMKKVIAYSSVSHMGFVILGLAAMNTPGLMGATFVMLSHGIVSAALFFCVGTLYVRSHTREISKYGGFAAVAPRIYWFFLLMGMASLGLPFLISFPGESLVFYGAYLFDAIHQLPFMMDGIITMQLLTAFAAIGVVVGAAYVLWLIQRIFTGPLDPAHQNFGDAGKSEVTVLVTMSVLVIVFGMCPHLLTERFDLNVEQIAQQYTPDALHIQSDRYRLPMQTLSLEDTVETRALVASNER